MTSSSRSAKATLRLQTELYRLYPTPLGREPHPSSRDVFMRKKRDGKDKTRSHLDRSQSRFQNLRVTPQVGNVSSTPIQPRDQQQRDKFKERPPITPLTDPGHSGSLEEVEEREREVDGPAFDVERDGSANDDEGLTARVQYTVKMDRTWVRLTFQWFTRRGDEYISQLLDLLDHLRIGLLTRGLIAKLWVDLQSMLLPLQGTN
ncbi:hypothetical protein BU15DRAFT_79301 [Melanogaster broomeanus]|nr:hypothetical protein BU15DRAFT_79301 [Melanogaster broomeanus]